MDEVLELLDEAGVKVENLAGPGDADRVRQFLSHLATCQMVVKELHGRQAASEETQE